MFLIQRIDFKNNYFDVIQSREQHLLQNPLRAKQSTSNINCIKGIVNIIWPIKPGPTTFFSFNSHEAIMILL
jgi:hypothetical protein